MNLQLTGFPEVETVTDGRRNLAHEILLRALKDTEAVRVSDLSVAVRDRALEDGAGHAREAETVEIQLSPEDVWHLMPFVDADRGAPVALVSLRGSTRESVRDRSRDSVDGPGEREVVVEYEESVIAHVLNVRIEDGECEAEIEYIAEVQACAW